MEGAVQGRKRRSTADLAPKTLRKVFNFSIPTTPFPPKKAPFRFPPQSNPPHFTTVISYQNPNLVPRFDTPCSDFEFLVLDFDRVSFFD